MVVHSFPLENVIRQTMMNTPKLLPWLARRAGMPNEQIETLWMKALSRSVLTAPNGPERARIIVAMQDLLATLGLGEQSGNMAWRGTNHAKNTLSTAMTTPQLPRPVNCVGA